MADDDLELWWSDRKSHYTNIALEPSNASAHPDWDPSTGFAANPDMIVDVYGYYRGLALDRGIRGAADPTSHESRSAASTGKLAHDPGRPGDGIHEVRQGQRTDALRINVVRTTGTDERQHRGSHDSSDEGRIW